MAILSNGKFYGFLCSVKETERKLTNGVKEYVEDFISGFAGHGWKLWEYMTGKWKLEIDTIVVRETMLVFEMLISKIRAIIGAQTISQGHGKVKSARISDDGTEYLIELEDEDVSIVAHDFVRCQTFVGDKTKLYHVEVSSVDVETKTLHVPLSEFDKDESGNVPAAGDELVQFGNSQNKARQSAIYMHADETGQPAIDVMFDLNSKNWEGKVKVRVGGDIPGSGGLKGFYCVNGMIKGVDSKGNIAYCIYPDGTAELGCGAALFKPDKSGHIAGGAIEWIWDESNQKCVCTMKDVVLTWDNLSDDAKENLKGEPGKNGADGNNGQDGKDGYDGIDGADGVNGKDGISLVYKGELSSHPANAENGWYYRNTTDKKSYVYQDDAWYVMTVDGLDGQDGLDIVWKGDSSIPPANPQKNWVYRDTDNGRVYIYNGAAWELMVADGNDGIDGTDGEPGTDGKDGMRVYITYHDSEEEPEKPIGDGTTNGWHTDSTESVIWISQKVSESADSGEWGDPIRVKGEPGKDGQDANLLPWIEKWNGYATELGEEYIVTPKMFSGTKAIDENGKVWLTGIVQGKDCLTAADGTKRTGIFALVDNEIVFELDPINRRYKFSGEVNADSGTFNGTVNADRGSIGGFEIASGRIGSEVNTEYGGGQLAIYNNLIRVGNSDSYSLLGGDTIPATAGGAYTSTCRFVNNTKKDSYNGANYGMMINVSGAKRNYGIKSDAPILATSCIGMKIARPIYWVNYKSDDGKEFDFSKYSVYLIASDRYMGLNLPDESTVASYFGLTSLPSDFSLMFTLHVRHWSYDIRVNNVYDWNANLINIDMVKGDSLTLLISKYDGFRYDVLNRQD
jgi:hypothetical protein|nr:MAG TPA: tail protein [Caudoviricetes sp.]